MKDRDLVSIPPTVLLETIPTIHTFILLPWPLPAPPVVNATVPGQYVNELSPVSTVALGSKTTVLQGARER